MSVWTLWGIVIGVWGGLTVSHVSLMRLLGIRWPGRRATMIASASLLGMLIAGAWLIWHLASPAEVFLKLAAVCLFLAGMVGYAELRSLLSRGYSLRMLVDLLSRNGSSSLEGLKSSYGNGMGMEGLLNKRLNTLASLGLLQREGGIVGPLTLRGRLVAEITSSLRRLLRLTVPV